MSMLQMVDLDLSGKRVLIRADLNVPTAKGRILNDSRIRATVPTIQRALQANATIIIVSHRSRPQEGVYDAKFSLEPIVKILSEQLNHPVHFIKAWNHPCQLNLKPGEVGLLENIRFQLGEKANDDGLAQKLAKLCDIFVMDAFGVAHRAHASTHGIAKYAPLACAGPLLTSEINALSKAIQNPQHPLIALVGGAKISTKLSLLEQLITQVEQIIVGGGIANTLIAAAGYPIGKSLHEADLIPMAKNLLALPQTSGHEITIPTDVVVAKEISTTAQAIVKSVDAIADDDIIVDLGPETTKQLAKKLARAKTIIWNGPLGIFEYEQFAQGTKTLAQAIADSPAFSLVGGGETIAVIDQLGLRDKISYISTGGGAFLQFFEHKPLPAISILQSRGNSSR